MDVKVERSDDEVDDCSVVDPLDVENCVDSVKNEPDCVQFMTVKDNDNAKGNSVSDSCEESSVTQEQPSDSSVATTEWMDVGSFRRVKTEPADPEDYICSGEVDGNLPDARLRIANIYSLTERFGESATVRVKQEPVSNFADGEVDDDSISEEYILGGRSDHDPIQCIVKGEPRHVTRVDCDTNKASTSVNDEDSDDDDDEDEGRVMDEDYDGGRETYEENESDVEGEVGRNSKGEGKGSLPRVKVKRRKSLGQRKEKSKKMRLHTKGNVMNSCGLADVLVVDIGDSDSSNFLREVDCSDSDESIDNMKDALTDADIENRRKWKRVEKVTQCTTCSRKIFNAAFDCGSAETYQCSVCIYEHFEKSHNKKESAQQATSCTIWKCSECEKLFPSFPDFQKHSATHAKQNLYKCSMCNVLFSDLNSLVQHSMTHEEKNTYRCGLCNKEVTGLKCLKDHMTQQHAQLGCNMCSESFSSAEELSIHLSLHTKSNILKCCSCNKTFNYNSFSSNHKDFTCITCTFKKQRAK